MLKVVVEGKLNATSGSILPSVRTAIHCDVLVNTPPVPPLAIPSAEARTPELFVVTVYFCCVIILTPVLYNKVDGAILLNGKSKLFPETSLGVDLPFPSNTRLIVALWPSPIAFTLLKLLPDFICTSYK